MLLCVQKVVTYIIYDVFKLELKCTDLYLNYFKYIFNVCVCRGEYVVCRVCVCVCVCVVWCGVCVWCVCVCVICVFMYGVCVWCGCVRACVCACMCVCMHACMCDQTVC